MKNSAFFKSNCGLRFLVNAQKEGVGNRLPRYNNLKFSIGVQNVLEKPPKEEGGEHYSKQRRQQVEDSEQREEHQKRREVVFERVSVVEPEETEGNEPCGDTGQNTDDKR